MGVNYYLHCDEVPIEQGFTEKIIHLGKSSAGWHFSLRIYPEIGIRNLDDIVDLLTVIMLKGAVIKDEYGVVMPVWKFFETVQDRKWHCEDDDFTNDPYVEKGLNGLLRAKVDGEFSVGHGEGTYDYFVGEFS